MSHQDINASTESIRCILFIKVIISVRIIIIGIYREWGCYKIYEMYII